jgi:hypothetical protein
MLKSILSRTTEGLDRGRDQRPRVVPDGDVAEVRHRLAADRGDLVADGARRILVAPAAVAGGAEVVHHHTGPEARQLEGLDAAESRSRTRSTC